MSHGHKVFIIFICLTVWIIAFNILKNHLSPDGIFLVILLSLVAVFVITFISFKRWENAIQKSASDFREKHPPVSVTRFPVKRN